MIPANKKVQECLSDFATVHARIPFHDNESIFTVVADIGKQKARPERKTQGGLNMLMLPVVPPVLEVASSMSPLLPTYQAQRYDVAYMTCTRCLALW